MTPDLPIDPRLFAPLLTAPGIEQAVQYLKNQWSLPTKLAPWAALLVGVIFSDAFAVYMAKFAGSQLDLLNATLIGLGTGFLTSTWHEITKDPKPEITTQTQVVNK